MSRYAMTDSNGEFRFEGVADGTVKLEAERPGFFKPKEGSGEATPDLQIDRDLNGIVLKLVPWAEIAVHVRSITGVPIQDYPVRLYERQIVDGALQWGDGTSVVTGVDGFCRIYSVHEGAYVLSGGPELWRPRPPGAKQFGYPLVFYPNVRELSAATVFTVTAGQKAEVEFSLSQEPLFEVSGNVVDVPEEVDTKITLSSIAGDPVRLQQPHPARHDFSGYATAGRYMLRASAEVNGQPVRAILPLTIGANMTGTQVVLTPQTSIRVNVTSEAAENTGDRGSGSFAANVRLKSMIGLSAIELTATRTAPWNGTAMEISGVEPGRYSVEIDPLRGYVRTALSGSTDLLQNDLLVPENDSVEPIEIVLSDDGGEIDGNVKLPDPNRTDTVLLVPERGPIKALRTMTTQAGAFTFEQVAPGSYLLFAFDRVKDLEYRNADVLGTYLSSATHMSVSSHQHVTTTLDEIKLEK